MLPGPRVRSVRAWRARAARAAGHREGGPAGVGAGLAAAQRLGRGQRVRRRCKPGRARRRCKRGGSGRPALCCGAAQGPRPLRAADTRGAERHLRRGRGRGRRGPLSRGRLVPAGRRRRRLARPAGARLPARSRAASVGRPRRRLRGRRSAPASVAGERAEVWCGGSPGAGSPPALCAGVVTTERVVMRDRLAPGRAALRRRHRARAPARGGAPLHSGPGARAGRRGLGEGGRGRVGGVRHHAARGVPRGARRGRRQVALRQRGARAPRPRCLRAGRAAAGAGPAVRGAGRAAAGARPALPGAGRAAVLLEC
jgi:hypothetical protein